jgi:demethylmenaquinone methyltransferase/2-methoxy-6-polyprenyl-1,4-benzoquinol methylase
MTTNDPTTPPPASTTDFGFQQVPVAEKAARVRQVFESVAGNYDLMNDLMSAGTHRLWKRFALSQTGLRPSPMCVTRSPMPSGCRFRIAVSIA